MDQPPPSPELAPDQPRQPMTSLVGRLFNVFATPGEVFEEVKAIGPRVSHWLVPGLLFVLVSWLGGLLVFSQPTIRQQITELTDKQIQKQIEKTKMPAEQAEKMRGYIELTFKAAFVVGPIIPPFVFLWLWGLIFWLAGNKIMKGDFSYMKGVEVIGLSNMIPVLEAIVKTLLIVVTGNLFASPSLAMLIKDFSQENPMHTLLALVNVMTLWHLSVRTIGLARLAGKSFAKAAVCVFGVWVAYSGLFWGIGFLMRLMVKASSH
jgi:hypothetical protein